AMTRASSGRFVSCTPRNTSAAAIRTPAYAIAAMSMRWNFTFIWIPVMALANVEATATADTIAESAARPSRPLPGVTQAEEKRGVQRLAPRGGIAIPIDVHLRRGVQADVERHAYA